MLDYGSLSWNPKGQAVWRNTREFPCVGPAWSKSGCTGRWRDEYGSSHYCPVCTYGNGKMSVIRFIRVPQYDVTNRPRKGWKLSKRVIDKAYKA